MKVLCSIPTRGRYDTTLPMTLMAVINQTKAPDKVVIFDDNDEPKDVRQIQHYAYMFQIMEQKDIKWEWVFAKKLGQHYSHQLAQEMAVAQGYEWVWRVDDDCIPEATVLSQLYLCTNYGAPRRKIGAVGGAILTPPMSAESIPVTGLIENISREPNIQWRPIDHVKYVEHLHCSFLYRAGIHQYNLELSRVAHREETLFTYGLFQKGYDVILVPRATSWHLKNREGGIRTGVASMFDHDEAIFRNIVDAGLSNSTIVVLDCGLGDHIVFKKVLAKIKNPLVFSCYPEIIQGGSIAEARGRIGDLDPYNIYKKMDEWDWKESLEKAYCKLYNVE